MKEFEYLTEPELQALMTDCGLALECMFEKHGIGERPLFVLHLFNAKRCKVCREEQATAVRKPEVIIAREPKEVRIRILVGECELCGRTCFGRRPLTCNCAVIAPTCIEANHKHRAEVVGECARLGATG